MKVNLARGKHLLFVCAIVVLVLDIVTKALVRAGLEVGESVALLPFLSLTHVQNTGIAFGLFQFDILRWILVALALGVAVVIFWSCAHNKLREHYAAWGLIAGGAIGNALDRIWLGTVTDFVNLHFWPAFNVADSALTIGVVLLAWHAWRKE
jgi:signal peptidase II